MWTASFLPERDELRTKKQNTNQAFANKTPSWNLAGTLLFRWLRPYQHRPKRVVVLSVLCKCLHIFSLIAATCSYWLLWLCYTSFQLFLMLFSGAASSAWTHCAAEAPSACSVSQRVKGHGDSWDTSSLPVAASRFDKLKPMVSGFCCCCFTLLWEQNSGHCYGLQSRM